MSTSTFAERFKNRTSMLSTSGNIETNPIFVITKPKDYQVHGSLMQSNAGFILKKAASPQPVDPSVIHKPAHSLNNACKSESRNESVMVRSISNSPITKTEKIMPTEIRKKNTEENKINHSCELIRNSYKPYTIEDYMNIKRNLNFKLGGLGANIGSQEWQNKKNLIDKRLNYGLKISVKNTQNSSNKILEPEIHEKKLQDLQKKYIKLGTIFFGK